MKLGCCSGGKCRFAVTITECCPAVASLCCTALGADIAAGHSFSIGYDVFDRIDDCVCVGKLGLFTDKSVVARVAYTVWAGI